MFRNFKVLLIALIVIVVAGSAYAFAAANTVPASAAGSGKCGSAATRSPISRMT